MRIDQWLWAVRVYKSRSLASDAIRAGQIRVNGSFCKPSHEVRPGETVTVNFWDRERMLRVLGAPDSRIGAKLVPEYAEELQTEKPVTRDCRQATL